MPRLLKALGLNDWKKKFHVQFVGEPGLDYGGPRREFFELVGQTLFDVSSATSCAGGGPYVKQQGDRMLSRWGTVC